MRALPYRVYPRLQGTCEALGHGLTIPLVRQFASPPVLAKALTAGAICALATVPRLMIWQERTDAVWFMAGLLGWCLFVLWGFVFAWEPIHGHAKSFTFQKSLQMWGILSCTGLLVAALLHFGLDPVYQKLFPKEFPADPQAWIAFTLFDLALTDLFLCFAPLAFFARLIKDQRWVIGLTIGFNLLVLGLKLGASPESPPLGIILALTIYRLIDAAAAVYLYRWGGVWPVWYLTLLIDLRHLFPFIG